MREGRARSCKKLKFSVTGLTEGMSHSWHICRRQLEVWEVILLTRVSQISRWVSRGARTLHSLDGTSALLQHDERRRAGREARSEKQLGG